MLGQDQKEFASCGVGFVANLEQSPSHENLKWGLTALKNLEHRGGVGSDFTRSDGAGILTDIPHAVFGLLPGDAVANLFLPADPTARIRSLTIFESTFQSLGLEVFRYREIPINPQVFGESAKAQVPAMIMAFIRKPSQCPTRYAFEKMLYAAKQLTRSRLREAGIVKQFFFTSLSAGTIVYKALTTSEAFPKFYLDLQNPEYKTRFTVFHRRFSTNTATTWDMAQPFRVVAHNGEINTISGNRAWALAREHALGLREDELLTHRGISDSGSVNEIIEALLFRSSIPHPEDILAILMPPRSDSHPFYQFWSRAMEPWDGPALFTFSDGRTVGARLDRSGFRPCRWARTEKNFFLSSEAGSFEIPDQDILEKGCLSGSGSVSVDLRTGTVNFKDASESRENLNAEFDPRTVFLQRESKPREASDLSALKHFNYSEEDILRVLSPLIKDGKEGIGSMGDTARMKVLSKQTRSFFDYFYQRFAQVTNPPLDYLRERMVTDMSTVLGRKANIFEPKELLPLKVGIELEGPVLSLSQMDFLKSLERPDGREGAVPAALLLETTFERHLGVKGVEEKLEELKKLTLNAVKNRISLIILSDRNASEEKPHIPVVLVLSTLRQTLLKAGMSLRVSFVLDCAEIKSVHALSVVTGFGAAAVCPYLVLELAREAPQTYFGELATTAEERELKVVQALETGLLKVMSKMGVSAFQSYVGAELFSILGLSENVHKEFFPNHKSLFGGHSLEKIVDQLLKNTSSAPLTDISGKATGLLHNYLLRENPKGSGEAHSMTIGRSKEIHKKISSVESAFSSLAREPITLRHLLSTKKSNSPIPLETVAPLESVLKTFGSGGMSFGAISAESQRDILLAMKEIGGRSNSGEGGENPYYFSDGVSAQTKQIASGRFGVTAEYIITASEVQIKIAQGAKPGEGGQLMASKVNAEIARARNADPGVNLISPPPMHDIYSIEDLKQLIYELRQLKPDAKISVKLVSGENIGTIAAGVAKAGADIIQISGHDGGTGAAAIESMKHAGLPWEIGLWEVHKTLTEQGLRSYVKLRVDGGLIAAEDVIQAAILGAEEFDFGKALLVAEGCIMARVCEKNTCPTGIATHDPQFKKLYRGTKDKVVHFLKTLAEEIRVQLSELGVTDLNSIVGRRDLLTPHPQFHGLIAENGLHLDYFLGSALPLGEKEPNPFKEETSLLNQQILNTAQVPTPEKELCFYIRSQDRAALLALNGAISKEVSKKRRDSAYSVAPWLEEIPKKQFVFGGTAGQGFAAFLQEGMYVRLHGEANDSVAKSMSGGKLILTPFSTSRYSAHRNAILGNTALYGATGGILYVNGLAGNRFAVRNSGALAVVEGVGMHACEYMTRGTVIVLGNVGQNVGAGMTGGEFFILKEFAVHVNAEYVAGDPLTSQEEERIRRVLKDYWEETGSVTAKSWLVQRNLGSAFLKFTSNALRASKKNEAEQPSVVIPPPISLAYSISGKQEPLDSPDNSSFTLE